MKRFASIGRGIVVAVLALAFMTSWCAAQGVTMLDDVLKPLLEEEQIPAIAAAVMQGDRMIAVGAVGVREVGKDETVSIASRWHLGSCTKAITATMIGQLVNEGIMSWNMTVIEVMPDLKGKIDPACETITVRQLLTHTAGLPSYTHPSVEENKLMASLEGTSREQRRQFVEKLLAAPPLTTPGTKFDYSNAGYGVVAALAEEKMDLPWERLIYMRMGAAVGMSSMGVGWPRGEGRDSEPLGHWRRDGKCVPHDPAGEYQLPPALEPAGDVYCNISDFARFASIHLRGLRGQTFPWITSRTIRDLHQPGLENYGSGWMTIEVAGRNVQWHNGSAGTFFTWMSVDAAHDIAIVVATNCGESEDACRKATERLFEMFAPVALPTNPKGENNAEERKTGTPAVP